MFIAAITHLCAQHNLRTAPQQPNVVYSTNSVISTLIGESSTNQGYLLSEQRQLSTVNTVGTNGGSVAFIFRQNWQNCGQASIETGTFRYNLSSDGGQSWFTYGLGTNCMGQGPLNAGFNYPGRYPNVALFSDGMGNAVSNLNLAYSSPTIDGTVWTGAVLGTANNLGNIAGPTVNQEDYVSQGTVGVYNPTNIAIRVAGEFWAAVVTAGNFVEIRKGNFSIPTANISWNIAQTIDMNPLLTNISGSNSLAQSAVITFSPDGQKGYLVMTGDLIGGWDSCANAIICDYNLATAQFDAPYEKSFNDFTAIPQYISQMATSFALTNVNKANMINPSVTVDSRGELHIHALIAPSGGSPFLSYFGFATDLYDMTKDANGNWGAIHTAVISNATNPTVVGTITTNYYTFPHISRSPDGSKIMYSWGDTDTTGMGTMLSSHPNLKGRLYDVVLDKISPITDWTYNDVVWAGMAEMPKTAEVSFEIAPCTFRVPTTVSKVGIVGQPEYYYFSNIEYSCSQATDTAFWVKACDLIPITLNPVVTPASCSPSANDGVINLNVTGNFTGYTSFVTNSLTGITDTFNSTIIPNLAAGLYDISIMGNNCSSSMQSVSIALNQGNAPTITATPVNSLCGDNSSCINLNAPSGGCTYLWNTGATTANLCNVGTGQYWVEVNCGGCSAFALADIVEPAAISINANPTNISCSGLADGAISTSIMGGTPPYNYLWSGSTVATTPNLTGLSTGTYVLSVTDANGCQVSSSPLNIVSPTPLNAQIISSIPFLTAFATGGTGTYVYSWSGPPCFPSSTGSQSSILVDCASCGGIYSVGVIDEHGCIAMANTSCSVSTDKEVGISALELSPNPASQMAILRFSLEKEEEISLSILNVHGQIMLSKKIANALDIKEEISVKNWAKGMYYVQILRNSGSVSRKLWVE